jgi:hypothetical protein
MQQRLERRRLFSRIRRIEKAYPGAAIVRDVRMLSRLGTLTSDLVSKYLLRSTSTLTGYRLQRRKAIQTLQSRGFDVSEENFDAFTTFLSKERDRLGKLAFDSDAAADRFLRNGREVRPDYEQRTDSESLRKWRK